MRVIALLKGAPLVNIEADRKATDERRAAALAAFRRRVGMARTGDLTTEGAQGALASLIASGRSHQTANHHRGAIRSFFRWLFESHRVRKIPLRGLAGYNAEEDPRHVRRTLSLEELRRLIDAAESGQPFKSMTGPMRALCYRRAVASGLRYEVTGSIRPGSFGWRASAATATVKAGDSRNRQTCTLPCRMICARTWRPTPRR
jgi:site-specific recombinase XerC